MGGRGFAGRGGVGHEPETRCGTALDPTSPDSGLPAALSVPGVGRQLRPSQQENFVAPQLCSALALRSAKPDEAVSAPESVREPTRTPNPTQHLHTFWQALAHTTLRPGARCIRGGQVLRKFHIKRLVVGLLAEHFCPRHDRQQTHVTHRNRWCFSPSPTRANNNLRPFATFGTKRADSYSQSLTASCQLSSQLPIPANRKLPTDDLARPTP